LTVVLTLGGTALAGTTWHVDGAHGSDSNNCKSAAAACKTIGHAISLASSGDAILVAAAVYSEHLTIPFSLAIVGANAQTTIVDGGNSHTVVAIRTTSSTVSLSELTIRNGQALRGGGISNAGTLTITNCTISGSTSTWSRFFAGGGLGGGIYNTGTLTLTRSTVSGNTAQSFHPQSLGGQGGGIYNTGSLVVTDSTIAWNVASGMWPGFASLGGGIASPSGSVRVSNSTISVNSAQYSSPFGYGGYGGNLFGSINLENSIVAYYYAGGNCSSGVSSNGHNLSDDSTCPFNKAGDMNNIDPLLGALRYNGGPTQTMALLPGSPAIDAGDPNGCKDNHGHLLETDQRGLPRPDKEDKTGCDMGPYERQTD